MVANISNKTTKKAKTTTKRPEKPLKERKQHKTNQNKYKKTTKRGKKLTDRKRDSTTTETQKMQNVPKTIRKDLKKISRNCWVCVSVLLLENKHFILYQDFGVWLNP